MDDGTLALERSDLRVTPIRDRGLLLMQTASASALQAALEQEIGLTLPPPLNTTALDGYAVLWLAPREWLLDLPAAEADPIATALTRRLSSSLAVVTDLSDGLVSLEVSGSGAAGILMTGCSLDLGPNRFPPGRVVRTALADVPAILRNPGEPERIHCLIERAFADHFLDWLDGTTPQ
jgi:sarcosine oxidase subunit gamma